MRYCLGVGCDLVVFFVRHLDDSALQWLDDIFHDAHLLVGASMPYQYLGRLTVDPARQPGSDKCAVHRVASHQCLSRRIDARAVQRVQRDNGDVRREVLLEGVLFWCLDGGLPGDYGVDFRGYRQVTVRQRLISRRLGALLA